MKTVIKLTKQVNILSIVLFVLLILITQAEAYRLSMVNWPDYTDGEGGVSGDYGADYIDFRAYSRTWIGAIVKEYVVDDNHLSDTLQFIILSDFNNPATAPVNTMINWSVTEEHWTVVGDGGFADTGADTQVLNNLGIDVILNQPFSGFMTLYSNTPYSIEILFSGWAAILGGTSEETQARVSSGFDLSLSFDTSEYNVPEPGAFWLFGSGLIVLAGLRRKYFRG